MDPKHEYTLANGIINGISQPLVEPICLRYHDATSGWDYWAIQGYSKLIVLIAFIVKHGMTELIKRARMSSRTRQNRFIIFPISCTYLITYILVPFLATWNCNKQRLQTDLGFLLNGIYNDFN